MINRNGSTHQRQPDHDDPLADYPLLRAERDRKSGGDVTQKRSNTETQKPNSSEEEVIAPPGGRATRRAAPPGATGSRDPAPKHAPCVSALLCNTTMDEGRFLPAAFEAARNEPLPAAAKKFLAPGMRRLVALCRVLQRAADQRGEEMFCLSCRVAGGFLGVSHMTANRWLNALQRAGVIFCPPEKVGKLTHGS
jgi:hypothetical protein